MSMIIPTIHVFLSARHDKLKRGTGQVLVIGRLGTTLSTYKNTIRNTMNLTTNRDINTNRGINNVP